MSDGIKPDLTQTAPARLSTRLAFFVGGFGAAGWPPIIPFAKSNVGVNEAQLGLLILCIGLGSVVAMPVAGLIAARRGARSVILSGGISFLLTLPVLATAGSPLVLALALTIFGAGLGALDVAMNVHASEIELREKRALMSGFHAQYSIGMLIGGAISTMLLTSGGSALQSSLICMIGAVGLLMLAAPRFLRVQAVRQESFVVPKGVVVLIAVLCAIAFLSEGVVIDWGALLLIDRGHFSLESAGIGFVVFSVAMSVTRLTGDWLSAKFGPFNLLFYGGLLAAFGFALMPLAPTVPLSLLGFVFVGLGAGNIVPVLFTLAGQQTVMSPALAITATAMMGYVGLLAGPAVVGFVAEHRGLSMSFLLVGALLVLVPLTAFRAVKPR